MYSEQLLEHFQHPRFVGTLPAPAVCVETSNPACGDFMRLCAHAVEGVIADVRYQVRGCTASIAAGSALAEWLYGRPLSEMTKWTPDYVESALGGVPDTSRHVLALCGDAVRSLIAALHA
jgi:nitrogen fixation NifU-like protein